MQRFAGTCEPLCPVDVGEIVEWIAGIEFKDWPQQHRLADGKIRPAMVTDPNWFWFAAYGEPIVNQIMPLFPECRDYQRMLSAVMPGHTIEPHTDSQAPYWVCRVHVPLTANPQSRFVVGGETHVLAVGTAYRVNTEAEHSVENDGETPRIHFMFDVRQT